MDFTLSFDYTFILLSIRSFDNSLMNSRWTVHRHTTLVKQRIG